MIQLITSTPISAAPFNQYWVQSVNITGSPTGKTSASVMFKPYNGSLTLDSTRVLNIPDVFGLAAVDSTFAGVMASFLAEIDRLAKARNII